MKLNDIEMVLYDYIESLPLNTENMQAASEKLHDLIESVIQDVCHDNDIDDYEPQY